MLPCSVTAIAGIFSRAACSSSSSTRQAPSSSEYSVCRCRWTKSLMGAHQSAQDVSLLPFDRGRRLTGDVEDNAIDPLHLVDDARRDRREQFVRQTRPVGCHAVL